MTVRFGLAASLVWMGLAVGCAHAPVTAKKTEHVCTDYLVHYETRPLLENPEWAVALRSATGGRLVYVGAEHSVDPSHPQYARLEQMWKELSPSVAFFDGPPSPLADELSQAVQESGESGHVRWLARRDDVPTRPLLPSRSAELRHLLSRFGARPSPPCRRCG